jgi:hypothetical protein
MATGDILLVLSGAGVRHPADTNQEYPTYPGNAPSEVITPSVVGLPFAPVSGSLPAGVELVSVTTPVSDSYEFNTIDLRVAAASSYGDFWVYGRDAAAANLSSSVMAYSGTSGDYYVYLPCKFMADLTSAPGVFSSYSGHVLLKLDLATLATSSGVFTRRYTVYPHPPGVAYTHLTRVVPPRLQEVRNGMASVLDGIFPAGGCSFVAAWGDGQLRLRATRNSTDATKSADLYFRHAGTDYSVTITDATPSPAYVHIGPADRSVAGCIMYIDTALMFKHHINNNSYTYTSVSTELVEPPASYGLRLTQSDYTSAGSAYRNLFLYNRTGADVLAYVSELQAMATATLGLNSAIVFLNDAVASYSVVSDTVPANGYLKLRYELSASSTPPVVGATSVSNLSVV